MEVTVDLGGRHGLDVGVSVATLKESMEWNLLDAGIANLLRKAVIIAPRRYSRLNQVLNLCQALLEVQQKCMGHCTGKIIIIGNGDVSCYPDLLKLVEMVSGGYIPVFLEYTSGKGFSSGKEAENLIEAGVRTVAFSSFSTNAELRRKYVNDRHPEAVLSNL